MEGRGGDPEGRDGQALVTGPSRAKKETLSRVKAPRSGETGVSLRRVTATLGHGDTPSRRLAEGQAGGLQSAGIRVRYLF